MASDHGSKFLEKRHKSRDRFSRIQNFAQYTRRADPDKIMTAMRVLSKKGL